MKCYNLTESNWTGEDRVLNVTLGLNFGQPAMSVFARQLEMTQELTPTSQNSTRVNLKRPRWELDPRELLTKETRPN